MPLTVQMEPEALKDLVKEVKETIAKDFIPAKGKYGVFTAAKLWKIESGRKRAMRTRKKFVL